MSNYQEKYLKYKNKYIELQNQIGGHITPEEQQILGESFRKPDRNHQQIQYCISQMKRLSQCMRADPNTPRKHQFFYTLGRIQELLQSKPSIWWNPFETMIGRSDYDGIVEYTDFLREAIGCEYDQAVLAKEC